MRKNIQLDFNHISTPLVYETTIITLKYMSLFQKRVITLKESPDQTIKVSNAELIDFLNCKINQVELKSKDTSRVINYNILGQVFNNLLPKMELFFYQADYRKIN